MGKMKEALSLVAMLLLAASAVAQTPPALGWNSWDAYGLTIDEQQYRDNVAVMAAKLKPFGFEYAVIDEGWYLENVESAAYPDRLRFRRDVQGRFIPTLGRFPSATGKDSFKALSDYVHSQGLKFGVHIIRGIPKQTVAENLPLAGGFHTGDAATTTDTCAWNKYNFPVRDNAAGQAWYDSLIAQYAAWGVDLLKVDCISSHPYEGDEIRMIHRAIVKATAKTGRPMILSLSPGPTLPAHADEVAANAQMWRISDDVWDTWTGMPGKDFPQSIEGQFDRAATWSLLHLPAGRYADLDMLPFGELRPTPGWGQPRTSRLTPDEQHTVLTLWALMRSPLIVGANLTLLDETTLRLLTNREVLRIDQKGMGAGQVEPAVMNYDRKLRAPIEGLRVWSGSFADAKRGKGGQAGHVGYAYAAMFNLADHPVQVSRSLAELNLVRGIHAAETAMVYDVWADRSLGRLDRVDVTIPPHGVVLLERR